MLTDTEGVVLRQIKTSYNRKMVVLFSKKFGKISAGTSINEKGKNRSTVAIRPFTYGRYELFKGRDSYNINSAEPIRSYYGIGEDVDKYFNGSYVLEFTEKILAEGVPAPRIFSLLIDFFDLLEEREKGLGTLVLAYQVKLLKYSGVEPATRRCAVCGEKKEPCKFGVREGGMICGECWRNIQKLQDHTLIYDVGFDIVNILEYFSENSLKNLKNLALKEETGRLLQKIVREYAAYHLDASDIKSEKLI